jgi:hypothetical protein
MDAPGVGLPKTPSARRRRGARQAVIGIAVIVLAGVLALHFTDARFRVSVSAQPAPSVSQCNNYFLRLHYGPEPTRMFCQEGRGRAWYRAVITKVGIREARPINCNVQAFDQAGHSLGRESIPLLGAFPGGPHLDRQQSFTVDWFLKTVPASAIDRLTGRCDASGFWGKPPI